MFLHNKSKVSLKTYFQVGCYLKIEEVLVNIEILNVFSAQFNYFHYYYRCEHVVVASLQCGHLTSYTYHFTMYYIDISFFYHSTSYYITLYHIITMNDL